MIESATWATQLDASNPRGTDPRSEGDAHLRLFKSVFQNEVSVANKQWVYTGDSLNRQSSASFSIETDQSGVYAAGRRLYLTGIKTGTVYGTVTSSTYSNTTNVNIRLDSGWLRNEALTPYVSWLTDDTIPIGKPVVSDSTTGGTGTAGDGKEHVLVSIDGVIYKLLYDGTDLGEVPNGWIWAEGFAATITTTTPAFLQSHTLTSLRFGAAQAALKLKSTGELSTYQEIINPSTYVDETDEWTTNRGAGAGSGFEARLIKTSGTSPTSGTLSTWVSLATDVVWQWANASPGTTINFTGGLQIRATGNTDVDASAGLSVSVSSESIS